MAAECNETKGAGLAYAGLMGSLRAFGLLVGLGSFALTACGSDEEGGSSSSASGGSAGSGGSGGSAGSATSGGSAGNGGSGASAGSGGCTAASGTAQETPTSLTASDGKNIAAVYRQPAQGSCLPALLLLHQFSSNKEQWEPYVEAYNDAGYATLALDLRGHGESDAQDGSFNDILSDPDGAPLDVQAGVEFLANQQAVDAERIGAIGTSIGANLTLVATTLGYGVKVAVPISPRESAIASLANNPETLAVEDMFCLAGETDGAGAQAQTCVAFSELATGTAQVDILSGSNAHGTTLLSMDGVNADIVEFLNEQL